MRHYILLFISFLILCTNSQIAVAQNNTALLIEINGAIGPANADFIVRTIDRAEDENAKLVIIQMDTPGGLDKSMREIVKGISNSSVPVATYVSPTGARAASAGTFILYASHIAAMAPGTNLGAASPVSIGGGGGMPGTTNPDKSKDKTKQAKSDKDTMKMKVTNDAIAYIRSLAELHGRNADWAEKAVREAASIPASEALKKNVIDLIATDLKDLLKKIDGKTLKVKNASLTLDTSNINIVKVEPDWRMKFLAVITDPSVAYILLLIGIYGLFFEFANPGFIVPGVAGAIALLIALYALQLLPINYAGLALIILGIIFMVAEAFVPSFGALGLGGLVAFVIGSIMLLDTELPAYQIAWPIIAGMAVANALFFFVVITLAVKAHRGEVVSGIDAELVGATGVAMADFKDIGHVQIKGEIWKAHSDVAIHKGDKVTVTAVKGLTATIEPLTITDQKED